MALAAPWSLVVATAASAQAPPGHVVAPDAEVPPLPTGPATLRGRVVLPGDPTAGADLPIALYALRPDGRPGLGGTRSDAEGRFTFENIANDPGTVYLLGTQYGEVPFGRRVAFEAGQEELAVELPLRSISPDAAALLTLGTTYKLDWIGAQLFVQVSHQLRNPGSEVVFVREAARDTAPPVFRVRLPEGVLEFVDGQGGLGEGLVRDGTRVAYWGPVYPGDQELRYGFLLPGVPPAELAGDDPEGSSLILSLPLPGGSGEVQLLTPETDPRPRAPGIRELGKPEEIDGVAYVRSSLGGLEPGGTVTVTLPVPPSTTDAGALRIARADYWIDHDDTAMRVTAEIVLDVDAPVRLLAPADASLIDFALPPDAEFLGVDGEAQAAGVAPDPDGGLSVRGPLPPGRSSLGFRYRVPVRDGAARLELSFERPVDLLNVLVADTGIVVDSPRLHKRRPFRQGTRIYLHREAYQIGAREPVVVELEPFARTEMPRLASGLIGIALAAGAAAFLVLPLRRARTAEATRSERGVSVLASERENVYEALRDLEHDHET
ncbi:MAG TPA: hypothetical protein ENO23_02785, partial [Alphaproteobacteria bacterium]|nr:hypothetical protein [Alphaproteobacteria bacterium]